MTIFERILAREIPANIVYENDDVLAFHDVAPQAPVHVLVIPKVKIVNFSNISEIDDAVIGRYFKAAAKVAALLGLEQSGYRVVLNNGKDGGQTVDYLHIHILGERRLSWPPG
jgi:histidine triad (HIT) family protein